MIFPKYEITAGIIVLTDTQSIVCTLNVRTVRTVRTYTVCSVRIVRTPNVLTVRNKYA